MGYPADYALTQPDKPAMIMAESGRRMSFAELDRRSSALAVLMRDSGLRAGDTVAVVSENRLEWAEVVWAAARAGFDLAPLNFHLGSAELGEMLKACDAKAAVVSPACRAAVERAAKTLSNGLMLWCFDGRFQGGHESGYELALAAVDERIDDEILGGRVMFSSGTTGTPKAIRHRPSVVHPRSAAPHLGEYTELFGLDRNSTYLSPAPNYHTAPFRFVFAVTQLGGTVVCMERFDAATALCLNAAPHSERAAPALSRCSPDRCPNACLTARHREPWQASIADGEALLADRRLSPLQRAAITRDNERKRRLIAHLMDGDA